MLPFLNDKTQASLVVVTNFGEVLTKEFSEPENPIGAHLVPISDRISSLVLLRKYSGRVIPLHFVNLVGESRLPSSLRALSVDMREACSSHLKFYKRPWYLSDSAVDFYPEFRHFVQQEYWMVRTSTDGLALSSVEEMASWN